MAEFKPFELRIVKPDFGSSLTDAIMELNHLRKLRLSGTTKPWIFFQLKALFHDLESFASARIEGNNTTLAEYTENKIEENIPQSQKENFLEIDNMSKAMDFIDEQKLEETAIDDFFIRELHKITVTNLNREGDLTPGKYRECPVKIKNAEHVPPPWAEVPEYMKELIDFINQEREPKYDLLKIALAHHRFSWIHPFKNGNGRTVRLLTYAMLIKQGFRVKQGRILNPTAVFCNNRDQYYDLLAVADTGEDSALLKWCEYVLNGLRDEITKVDKLTDYKFLSEKILIPAINSSLKRKIINKLEANILKIAVKKQSFQSSDIETLMPGKTPSERSRVIAKLKKEKLIRPLKEGGREYFIRFHSSYLLRDIIKALKDEGFIESLV